MTAPNSAPVFLNAFSVDTGVVSSALVLEGRVEMSMGVRIMVFTLEQVGEWVGWWQGSGKTWPLISF
jgi:hypothetical protein